MTKAAMKQIDKAFNQMSDSANLKLSKNVITIGKALLILTTLEHADKDSLRKIYGIVLGTITIAMAYEKIGIITCEDLDKLVRPLSPLPSVEETVRMENMRQRLLIGGVGENILQNKLPFDYEGLSQQFPDLQLILEEINYLINPALFTKEYNKLNKDFDDSINNFTQLVGNKLTPPQQQFKDSLIALKNTLLTRCMNGDPVYTLTNCRIIYNHVDRLAKKIGSTLFTKNDIQMFSEDMAPYSTTSEWLAVLLKTILIAVSAMLAGMAIGGAPGMIIGGSVGTVGACIYSMWAAPEASPTDAVESAANAFFVR